MDTEVGRGVGQFHVVPGRGWQSKHCRRLQGTRQGRCGGCEPEVGGGREEVRASPSSGVSGLGTSGPLGGPGDGSGVTLPMLLESDALLTH